MSKEIGANTIRTFFYGSKVIPLLSLNGRLSAEMCNQMPLREKDPNSACFVGYYKWRKGRFGIYT